MILWIGIAVILLVMSLTVLMNAFTFPRLGQLRRDAIHGVRAQSAYTVRTRHAVSSPADLPRVSILIPARNEARSIEQTIANLVRQHYPDYEIVLLDDHSTDETAAIAQQAGDAHLRIIHGQDLPQGWLGKNWACHQLSQAADPASEWLIFTDADVLWHADALAALVAQMPGRDMLTVWATQHTQTWGERLVVPLMAMVILGYLPEIMVRRSPFAAFAAANGQCIALRRNTYTLIGGHEAVKAHITEDVALAKRTKRAGKKLAMLDGNQLISCRMYHNWAEVRDGFAKNILAGHGNSIPALMASTVLHWALFILPWVWLLIGHSIPLGEPYPAYPLALIGLGIGIRMLSAKITHQRLADSLLLPLSVLLMTRIAAQAVAWRLGGKTRWKGRSIAHGQ